MDCLSVRAGSNPVITADKRPVRLAARMRDPHSRGMGSIPIRVTDRLKLHSQVAETADARRSERRAHLGVGVQVSPWLLVGVVRGILDETRGTVDADKCSSASLASVTSPTWLDLERHRFCKPVDAGASPVVGPISRWCNGSHRTLLKSKSWFDSRSRY